MSPQQESKLICCRQYFEVPVDIEMVCVSRRISIVKCIDGEYGERMQMNEQHKGRVHIGVGGGIAAFKVVQLASSLVKSGYTVHVGMTPSAQAFVGPLSFQAVTGNVVFTSLTDPGREGDIGHISFAQDCDILVIAPATANLLAKAALGLGMMW